MLDSERAQISVRLPLSADRIDEAVYSVLTRLAASSASATFSYSCRDTREFRETYAFWLMLQAFRLKHQDAKLSYTEMKAELGEPKSAIPQERERALSPNGWWLRSVVDTGDEGVKVVNSSFAGVAQGRVADGRRESSEFTEFDDVGMLTRQQRCLTSEPKKIDSYTSLRLVPVRRSSSAVL